MKLLKKWALVPLLASLFLNCSVSNSQELAVNPDSIYTTENLIGNTGNAWDGCYSNQSGSFWGGYSGGPCPGYDSNTGQIIFSYGYSTLWQSIALSQALSGSGLQINGYNWGWSVKNSNINGTQPGSYDPVAHIDVALYDSTGNILQQDRYDYGYWLPNWTYFSGTRTYQNPYRLGDVSNLTLSITSMDSGYWAGYYGPEFNNFSLSVNYSVDPCYNDPLYSASCPGYFEKLQSLTVRPADFSIVPTLSQTAVIADSAGDAATTIDTGGVLLSTNSANTGNATAATVEKESAPVTTTESDSKEKKSTNVSLALSIIQQNKEKEEALVANILKNNEAIATSSYSSQTSLVENLLSSINEQASQSALVSAADSDFRQTQNQPVDNSATGNAGTLVGLNPAAGVGLTNMVSRAAAQSYEVSQTANTSYNTSNSDITAKAFSLFGPINNILDSGSASTDDNKQAGTATSVKKQVEPNAAAGTTDIAAIAQTPAGFESYLQAMTDKPFYEPKEIYRGQRTVDNARLQRSLTGSSEALYNQMIEDQYKIGN